MDKIQVEICMGTTCHVFGSAELVKVADFLSGPERERVEIKGSPCLGACRDDNYGGAPFVRVDGKLVSRAGIDDVLEAIRRRLAVAP